MLNTLITGQGGVSTIITNKAKSKEQGIMGGLMDKIGNMISGKKEDAQGTATEAAPPSGNAPSAPDSTPASDEE